MRLHLRRYMRLRSLLTLLAHLVPTYKYRRKKRCVRRHGRKLVCVFVCVFVCSYAEESLSQDAVREGAAAEAIEQSCALSY
jgi:hypothetical protein